MKNINTFKSMSEIRDRNKNTKETLEQLCALQAERKKNDPTDIISKLVSAVGLDVAADYIANVIYGNFGLTCSENVELWAWHRGSIDPVQAKRYGYVTDLTKSQFDRLAFEMMIFCCYAN